MADEAQNKNEQKAGDSEVSALTGVLGCDLPGEEMWACLSPRQHQPHDRGCTPNGAVKEFVSRTGIEWKDAIGLGWHLVRVRIRYRVTGILIE